MKNSQFRTCFSFLDFSEVFTINMVLLVHIFFLSNKSVSNPLCCKTVKENLQNSNESC